MNNIIALQPAAATRPTQTSLATWIGLLWSLFGMLAIREVVKRAYPASGAGPTELREGLMFAGAVGLLLLVTLWEKLPLTSIGLGTTRWWKSLLWSLPLTVACLLAAGGLVYLTNYGHGKTAAGLDQLPLWLVTVIVLRAGIVEELFYRGFAIERLQAMGLGRWAAALIPLVIFSVGHWTGGAANILIAFVLGAFLSLFYLWRRDLVANMFAHFLVDFLGNVMPRLLHVK
jgi:CAAX protease family protein